MPSEPISITVGLGPELKAELAECAKRLELTENALARHAIRAAVKYIRENGYCLGPPFQMTLPHPSDDRLTPPDD